jgi:hypothetical protein
VHRLLRCPMQLPLRHVDEWSTKQFRWNKCFFPLKIELYVVERTFTVLYILVLMTMTNQQLL